MTEEDNFYEEGLSTNMRPKSNSAMKVSDQLEKFLTQVERKLLSVVWYTYMPENK